MQQSQHIDAILEQVTFAAAAGAAYAGRYQEAEVHLSGLMHGGGATNLAALDLLARIRAQQGRLSEAEGFWRQVLQSDPMNEYGLEGLRCIAYAQRPVLINHWRRFLSWAGGFAILIFGIWTAWHALLDVRTIIDSEVMQAGIRQKQTMERLAEVGKSHAALAKDMELVLSRMDRMNPSPQKHLIPRAQHSARKIAIVEPGVLIKEINGNVQFVFASGLFEQGALLLPDARSQLSALGRELSQYGDRMALLHVTGYTDDLPMPPGKIFSDNTSLGFSRALVVVNHLRSNPGLSSVPFSISANGPDPAPYLNEGASNRRRNRTATITISWLTTGGDSP